MDRLDGTPEERKRFKKVALERIQADGINRRELADAMGRDYVDLYKFFSNSKKRYGGWNRLIAGEIAERYEIKESEWRNEETINKDD